VTLLYQDFTDCLPMAEGSGGMGETSGGQKQAAWIVSPASRHTVGKQLLLCSRLGSRGTPWLQ
jgi:hypothetical protein